MDSAQTTPTNQTNEGQRPVPLTPAELAALVSSASTAHGLPSSLVAAMVQVESAGVTDATRFEPAFYTRYVQPAKLTFTAPGYTPDQERKGLATSWGLLQVMGDTARCLGFREPFEQLLDPPTGLYWGCQLIMRLRDRVFDPWGWAAVCAAYNGGLGAVRSDGSFSNPQYPAKVLAKLGGKWPPKE